uniref:Long-distance movement protein n=1 Tax=Tobacco bushy top virus TaxID=184020 RepID=A0A1W5LJR9_9TOMB|nr:hypothetical protein [Tobacco bushy top virus]
MSTIINVNTHPQGRFERGATKRSIRGSNGKGARGIKPRRINPPPGRKQSGYDTTAAAQKSRKDRQRPQAFPPHETHGGAAVRREDRGGVHTPRAGRCWWGSRNLGTRQHATTPQQRWAPRKISNERRAQVDSILSPLLDTIKLSSEGGTQELLYCVGILRGELRRRREPVQSAHNVGAEGRVRSTQLLDEASKVSTDLPASGEGQSVLPNPNSGGTEKCNVESVCNNCDRAPTTNKW